MDDSTDNHPQINGNGDWPHTVNQILNEDEGHYRSNAILPWDQFSNWIHCACVVTFDLELGQAMEV